MEPYQKACLLSSCFELPCREMEWILRERVLWQRNKELWKQRRYEGSPLVASACTSLSLLCLPFSLVCIYPYCSFLFLPWRSQEDYILRVTNLGFALVSVFTCKSFSNFPDCTGRHRQFSSEYDIKPLGGEVGNLLLHFKPLQAVHLFQGIETPCFYACWQSMVILFL